MKSDVMNGFYFVSLHEPLNLNGFTQEKEGVGGTEAQR